MKDQEIINTSELFRRKKKNIFMVKMIFFVKKIIQENHKEIRDFYQLYLMFV
jgi:hypothetical protein